MTTCNYAPNMIAFAKYLLIGVKKKKKPHDGPCVKQRLDICCFGMIRFWPYALDRTRAFDGLKKKKNKGETVKRTFHLVFLSKVLSDQSDNAGRLAFHI